MLKIKNYLKEENVKSDDFRTILVNYKHKDLVKIALYCAKSYSNNNKHFAHCINLIEKWLINKKHLTFDKAWRCKGIESLICYSLFSTAKYCNNAISHTIETAIYSDIDKEEEFKSYARLFAYEDLSYPYKDFAKTFNLNNNDDLNIFLDFLTDNYHEAIAYSREEYFRNKLAREYLRVIYQ